MHIWKTWCIMRNLNEVNKTVTLGIEVLGSCEGPLGGLPSRVAVQVAGLVGGSKVCNGQHRMGAKDDGPRKTVIRKGEWHYAVETKTITRNFPIFRN
eukprot:3343886-Amphidinium_carterae.1